MSKPKGSLRIAVDFDGTLVDVNGEGEFVPILGAKEALEALIQQGCYIIIHTCRTGIAWRDGYLNEELELIRTTLNRFSIPFHEIFPGDKLVADSYIDDRAISFKGNWETILTEVMDKEE